MSKNIEEIPYTEIIERIKSLGRAAAGTNEKIRGLAQDVYMRAIPAAVDWNFLITDSGLRTTAQFKDGTCSVNTQGTTITFSSDVTITSSMIGRKIKVSGNNTPYFITGISTGATDIRPSFEGIRNASADSYVMYQDEYALAHNFDRFPKDGGFFRWISGRREVKPEWAYQEFVEDSTSSPSVPGNVRLVGINSGGDQLVQLTPPPSTRDNYGYDYFRNLSPLTETNAGTILSIDASATSVTGNTNCRFTEATTGDWFRIDALGTGQDSTWFRVQTITNDSALVLQTAFSKTSITTGANFSISKAPEYPVRMHPGVIYGALMGLTVDQNDPNAAFYRTQYAQIMSDSKKIYVSRVYSQQHQKQSCHLLHQKA